MSQHSFDIANGGIWAAIHTPFLDDGALDIDGLKRNVRHYIDHLGLKGVFYNGLMGEYWSLTLEERKRITQAIAGESGGRLGLAPNCTHHSIAETIALAEHAIGSGCQYVVLMNPPTGPRTPDTLLSYFMTVCSRVSADIIIFDTPASGYTLGPELIGRLVEMPNVKGVKAAGPTETHNALRSKCAGKAVLSDPIEENWLENLTTHRQTLLFADPEPYLYQTARYRPIEDYYSAFLRGDDADFRNKFQALSPLRRVYTRWIIGELRNGRPPNAALKVWAGLNGMAAGPVRMPVTRFSAATTSELLGEIHEALRATSALNGT